MLPTLPLFIQNIGMPGILLIAIVVLVLFGKGKISSLMGEVGKGITSFKRGVSDSNDAIDKSLTDASDEATDITPKATKKKSKQKS